LEHAFTPSFLSVKYIDTSYDKTIVVVEYYTTIVVESTTGLGQK